MRQECLASHSEEGAVDGADGARHVPAPAWSRMGLRLIKPVMDRQPLPVEQDAGVLHGAVGIEKTRADRTYFRTRQQASQLPVPVVAEHDHIVIRKDDQRLVAELDGPVVEPRPVERPSIRLYMV